VELDVAVAGEVGRNATVSTVGASAATDSTLNDNVVDEAALDIEALDFSVSLQVNEELTDGLDGLLGPSTKSGMLELLDLSVARHTTSEASVWDDLFLFSASLKVGDGSVELQSLNSLRNIVGVLEVNAEVSDLALGG